MSHKGVMSFLLGTWDTPGQGWVPPAVIYHWGGPCHCEVEGWPAITQGETSQVVEVTL